MPNPQAVPPPYDEIVHRLVKGTVQRYAGNAWGDGELLIGAGFDPSLYPLEHSSVRSLATAPQGAEPF